MRNECNTKRIYWSNPEYGIQGRNTVTLSVTDEDRADNVFNLRIESKRLKGKGEAVEKWRFDISDSFKSGRIEDHLLKMKEAIDEALEVIEKAKAEGYKP